MTGSIPKPVPNPKSTFVEDASKTAVIVDDYEERLEEWESIQSKILSWDCWGCLEISGWLL